MPSSSLSYWRAMVIAERRSPWADLLFLTASDRKRGTGTVKTDKQFNNKVNMLTWLNYTLFPVLFTWYECWTWLVLHVPSQTSFVQKSFWWCLHPGTNEWVISMYVKNTAHDIRQVSYSQLHTHLKHLRSRLIVSFGILDQQIYIFGHGTNTPVVAQLKANTFIG